MDSDSVSNTYTNQRAIDIGFELYPSKRLGEELIEGVTA